MEFALSEDQVMLQDSVRGVLGKAATLETVRKIAAGDHSALGAYYDQLATLGLGGLVVPEEYGGIGLGLLDAVLVQEAIGAFVVPGLLEHPAGAYGLSSKHMSAVADFTLRPTVALTEINGARDGAGIVVKGGKASGTALLVPDVMGATHVVCVPRSGETVLVATSDLSAVTPMQTIDRTRTFEKIEMTDAPAESLGPDAALRVLLAARILIAADTLGAAQAMLDKAVAYAGEREQFGRVIGSFQAVKHMCAEMAARIEPARALIWHAAHAVDMGDPEGPAMVHLAKAHMAEVGTFVARTSTEVHGGMGFTDLVGLHYWFKRIGVNRQLFGSPERAREDAARAQALV